MILRFRDTDNVERVVSASYIELEGISSGEIHNGKWVFKDNTYTTGHNEEG